MSRHGLLSCCTLSQWPRIIPSLSMVIDSWHWCWHWAWSRYGCRVDSLKITLHLGCEQGLKILGVGVDMLVENVRCTEGSADLNDVDI